MPTNLHRIELLMLLIAGIMAITGLYYLGPSITAFVIKESSYADGLSLVVTANGNYTWHLGNAGSLKSAKISGKVTTHGKARVYLENNGLRYLIFDSAKNESNETINASGNLITGFAVKDEESESDNDKKKKNKKPKWSGPDEFVANGTDLINLSQYFTDEDGDALAYAASGAEGLKLTVNNEIITLKPIKNESFNTTITFTASDGIDIKSHTVDLIVLMNEEFIETEKAKNETNQSLNITIISDANATQDINKVIAINLSYNSGTIYDANDNGEESVNGVVDVTVENSMLSWNADESRLCARWELYSIENDALTTTCNGNQDCCAFLNLLPTGNSWSEPYYAVFGKDSASYSNIISAQVMYYDVNISLENTKSEIYYSGWGNLSAKFFEEEIEFNSFCIDTCSLNGLNKSSYDLVFEIENSAVLRIDKIEYDILIDAKNKAPLLLQNFSAVHIGKDGNVVINLSQYFADPDGDVLNYNHYKADNITILFDKNTATITHDSGFAGERLVYIAANDSELSAFSNLFLINVSGFEAVDVASNISPLYFFEIRNIKDNKLAVFDSLGNLRLKGTLSQNIEPIADENDFAIQNSDGSLNAVIKNPEGNMLIKGSLNENQSLLIATQNSFIIQDKSNETVAYINSTGSLFLKGALTDNVLFEDFA
ncbi:hypothetical protein HYY70_07235 [Candidatus Woesearchaeota archaeon]|nr:hypothetical protein [Candidatus Woesearchaeota archaeon]